MVLQGEHDCGGADVEPWVGKNARYAAKFAKIKQKI